MVFLKGLPEVSLSSKFFRIWTLLGRDIGQKPKIANFGLCTNYPKKNLVEEYVTLESEGLCPQAVIMVQDLDA